MSRFTQEQIETAKADPLFQDAKSFFELRKKDILQDLNSQRGEYGDS